MRYVIAVTGVLLVIGALVFIKFSQISMLIGMGKEMEKSGPPPEAVGTRKAELQSWEGSLESVGTITSAKGVDISAEVPGVVSKILFESGKVVKEGDPIIELDASVERAQLVSAQVRLDLAQKTVKRSRALTGSGLGTQAQLEADESAVRSAGADIEVLNAQIKKKTIRAPFAGRLGIREVNLGQYLNPGTVVAALESVDTVYVDFTLPQQLHDRIKVGMGVRVTIENAKDATAEGTIDAIEPKVDPGTRTMKLRATVPNREDKLRAGMFAQVSVLLPKRPDVVAVPATAVMHASFGDSVFVVEEKTPEGGGDKALFARQQFVKTGEARGDFVEIVEGVKAGEEVVSAGAFKLKNGAKVVIDNSVENVPKLDPKPENH